MLLPTASWAGCQPARVKSELPIKWQFWLAPSKFRGGGGVKKNLGGPPCITPMPMNALAKVERSGENLVKNLKLIFL
jgi:hypothetical protein